MRARLPFRPTNPRRSSRGCPLRGTALLVTLLSLATVPAAIAPARADSLPPATLDSAASPAPATLAPGTPALDGDSARALDADRVARSLAAQVTEARPESLRVEALRPFPIFLGGREIFRVARGREGSSTEERASAIRGRLAAVVRDATVPADSVRLISTDGGVEVRVGAHLLWVITPADVEGLSVTELAARMGELPGAIADGIRRERAQSRPLGIAVNVVVALAITLVAWVLLRLLLAASRRWRGFLVARLPSVLRGIRFRNFEVLSQVQLVGVVTEVLVRLDVLVGAVLAYGYVTTVFSLFPWTQGWGYFLFRFAGNQLLEGLRAAGESVPGLLVIAVIVMVIRWLSALSDRFFDAIDGGILNFASFHPELARPSKKLARILLWVFGVMIAYPYIPGTQSRAVQGISLLLGVMVSLGSTGIVGNMLAGIVLTYSRSFRAGDRVRIGEQVGDVTHLGFFATKLRTIRNEEVTIPNGQVASSAIVNLTRLADGPGLIVHTAVTIGYDVDWRKVHGLLNEAAARVEAIEQAPPPRVYQTALNDFHVNYELTATTRESHELLELYSRLHEEIQDAFARAGIEILSPGYHAVRDANAPVLPSEPQGPRANPGGFRLRGRPDDARG